MIRELDMNEKFQCAKCGECCKNKTKDGSENSPGFDNDFIYALKKLNICFFDWEKKKIENILDEKGIGLVPGQIVHDLKNNSTIVISYTTTSPDCPFLSTSKECEIYDIRPVICRLYPVFIGVNEFKGSELIIHSPNCSNDFSQSSFEQFFSPKIDKHEVWKNMYHRYGDSFLSKLFHDLYINGIMRFLTDLKENGIIKPAEKGYKEKKLRKMIKRSQFVDFNDFMQVYFGPNPNRIIDLVNLQIQEIRNDILESK